jgi:peroxiredoxin
MLRNFAFIAAGLVAFASTNIAAAAVKINEPAPDFTLTDSKGTEHSLSDFRGKTVVLEWTNAECPFVVKHYQPGNMQRQQAEATAEGVVWLTINSGAAGKQGHVDGAGANAVIEQSGGKQTAYLLDAEGTVGRLYGARTTPHMFVIDGEGVLRYMGAIDSNPSGDPADIEGATQYVEVALAELAAGKPVTAPVSQPYGCSVKY